MTYTQEEANYFYWHCRIAALLIEQFADSNTATDSHVHRAVRMATETAVGKRGVRFASQRAKEIMGSNNGAKPGQGLVREHAVPVSVITRQIRDAYASNEVHTWGALMGALTEEDLKNWGVVCSSSTLSQDAPFSAVIARIVRESTVLAWITLEEERELRKRGLVKAMPPGYDGDVLARYKFCRIDVMPLDLLDQ